MSEAETSTASTPKAKPACTPICQSGVGSQFNAGATRSISACICIWRLPVTAAATVASVRVGVLPICGVKGVGTKAPP